MIRTMYFFILFFVLITLNFVGCVTNYHVQTFSNDVEVTKTGMVNKKVAEIYGDHLKEEELGVFEASDFSTVMMMAKEAGYSKVISIEYGTKTYLGFIGIKWVRIRCI